MIDPVPLVAVAHGSRDPRSAATVTALAGVVRERAPGVDVRVAFLDLSAPRLSDVLDGVVADGHRGAVVVPLLLGNAYHARVDIPAAVRAARARHPGFEVAAADVLGADPRLETVAAQRLREVGAGERAVLLGAAGSSRESANEVVRGVAGRLGGTAVFASAGSPGVTEAVAARGDAPVAVGAWFLAPGRLPDRIVAAVSGTDAVVADVLGAHPLVADVVLDRYRAVTVAAAVAV